MMVLGFLGLLRMVLGAFGRIVLSPETMVLLLNERRRVRFHQPSRIKDAEEIRELVGKGQLKPWKATTHPPRWLVEEVGQHLRNRLSRLGEEWPGRSPSSNLPIADFLEKQAELREYESLILSTTDRRISFLRLGKSATIFTGRLRSICSCTTKTKKSPLLHHALFSIRLFTLLTSRLHIFSMQKFYFRFVVVG